MSQVGHQAAAYPGFSSMKQLGIIFYSPLDGVLVYCRVIPSIRFAGTNIYTPGLREALCQGKSVLPKNIIQCPQPGLEPGLLAPESSIPTMQPLRLPKPVNVLHVGVKSLYPVTRKMYKSLLLTLCEIVLYCES